MSTSFPPGSRKQIPHVALIGATGYARSHLEFILENHHAGRWQLASVTVINPDEAGEILPQLQALGVRIYGNYKEMLASEDRLDLVCIPTAIHWHTRMTLDALAAGANVYVEKPLAGSLSEVEEILAAREKSGRFVAVGFQYLYLQQTWQIKEWILAGKIGRIQCLKGIASAPRTLTYFQRNGWAGKMHVDGHPVFDSPLNNALAHSLNLLLFLGGEERLASTKLEILEANLYRVQPIETFDTASLRGRTNAGVEFFFHATHSAQEALSPVVRVEGDAGAIEWSEKGLRLETTDSGVQQVAEPGFEKGAKELRAEVLLKMLAGESTDYCSVEVAGAHVAFIEQLQRRFSTNQLPENRKILSDSNQWVIPDLLPALRRAYDTNTLLDLS